MNNTISLSFSDNSFQLVHSTSEGSGLSLVSCEENLYSKTISFDQIFSNKNIDSVIEALNSFKNRTNLQEFEIIFSIPFNFAKIKRVAYPNESDKKLKRSQIEWELASVISDNIKDYKISVLNESKNQKEYSEAQVVAINKELIKKLQSIAEKSGADISGVFLNCFSLENYLEQNNAFSTDQNHVFLKAGKKCIEYHFFLGKTYFCSFADLVTENNNRSREEIILERTSERCKQVENLAEQMNNTNNFNLIVYGNSVSEKMVETLKSGLSLSVEYAGIGNYSQPDGYKYIEAWGSLL